MFVIKHHVTETNGAIINTTETFRCASPFRIQNLLKRSPRDHVIIALVPEILLLAHVGRVMAHMYGTSDVIYHSKQGVSVVGRDRKRRLRAAHERRHVQHFREGDRSGHLRHLKTRRSALEPPRFRTHLFRVLEPLQVEADDDRERLQGQLLGGFLGRLAVRTHRILAQVLRLREPFQTLRERRGRFPAHDRRRKL